MLKKFLSLILIISPLTASNNVCLINNVFSVKDAKIIQNIEGGQNLEHNEYNWFTYLIFEKENHSNHAHHSILGCGSLIDSEWILTAGHVAKYYEDVSSNNDRLMAHFKFQFGNYQNVQKSIEVEIDQIFYHPSFNQNNLFQIDSAVDLAILHLKSPIYDVTPIKMHFDNQVRFPLSKVIALGQGSENINAPKSKLEIFYLDNNTALRVYGSRVFQQPLYSSENDFLLSTITDSSKNIQPGDSGGPVVKIINNKPYLIGLIKGSPQNITNPAPVFIGVGISKQFKWFDETIYNNQEKIFKSYQRSNYASIFNSWQNPRRNITNSLLNRLDGLYVGNPQVSPNTKLNIMFGRDYSYLLYKFIAENNDFNLCVDNWIENDNLPINFKMNVLLQMVTQGLHTKIIEFVDELKSYLQAKKFHEFIATFKKYLSWSNNNYKKIIRSSLINKIKKMPKDDNSQWINDMVKNNYQSFLKNINVPFDGGIGYFLNFNINNPRKFARSLKNASNLNAEDLLDEDDKDFDQEKQFVVVKTEYENIKLSFMNRRKRLIEYAYQEL